MPLLIKEQPIEGSTATIECTFKDTTKTTISSDQINSINWWLKDSSNATVNNRLNVSESKANPLTVVLTGNDLPAGTLTFSIKVIYDSNLGNNLALRDSITFIVNNLTYDD